MNITAIVFALVVAAITLTAAICDARTRRLPNRLTVPACLVGLAFHVIHGAVYGGVGGTLHGLLFALGGFATGFGILFVLWLIGGGGAGDVKMMGALGAWLGAKLTLYVFLFSALFIALATVVILVWQVLARGMGYTRRRYFNRTSTEDQTAAATASSRRRIMPYGVPLALATWWVLVLGLWRGWIQ